MKEIEWILFVVEFQPGLQEQLPEEMQYLESYHWSDIFNFVAEYKQCHQNVVPISCAKSQHLGVYIKKRNGFYGKNNSNKRGAIFDLNRV